MNKMQQQVHDFKVAMNGTDDIEVCIKLIEEEYIELMYALDAFKKLPYSGVETNVVDGMCDLIYVVLFLAEAMHLDLEPYFDEVQRTNMLKEPSLTGTHKITKPKYWVAPRIAEMLAEGVGKL